MELITDFKLPPLEEPEKQTDVPKTENLKKDSPLYKKIVNDLKTAGLEVDNIVKQNNYNRWLEYTKAKEVMLNRDPQDPNFKLNEVFLYHGTKADKDRICEEGFDDRLASKEGCFGKAVYFSDTPKKCKKYAMNNIMLLSRVMLGESKVYPDKKRDKMLQREPEKPQIPPPIGHRFYDSVKGCPRDFTEYVIYRDKHALIEYVIHFTTTKKEGQQSSQTQGATGKTVDDPDTDSSTTTNSSDDDDDDDGIEEQGVTDEEHVKATNSTDDDDDVGIEEEGVTDEEHVKDADRNSSDTEDEAPDISQDGPNYKWIPWFVLPSGELTAGEKKETFRTITKQGNDEAESMLNRTGDDLRSAIFLYFAYKQKKEEDARRAAGEKIEDPTIEDDKKPNLPAIEPTYESPEWHKLSAKEKTDNMDKVIGQFMDFTLLDVAYREIAVKCVTKAKYEINQALINYYSLQIL